MTTQSKSKATHVHAHAHAAADAAPSTTEVDTAVPAATPVVFIKPPPADANIPVPPEGVTNASGVYYRAALPRELELQAMPDVLEELARFSDYLGVFGKTAPPLAYVLQTFTAASEWSAMRVKTEAWDAFSRGREGAAWTDARQIMLAMGPALALAAKTDATIARQFPALVRLFGAKSVIAKRGVATRKRGKKKEAEQAVEAAKATTQAAPAAAVETAGAAAGAAAPVVTGAAGARSPVVPVVATPVVTGASNGAAGGVSHLS